LTRQKIFTLDEARDLLPELRIRLLALQEAWKAMAPYWEEAHRLAKRMDEGGGTMTDAGHYLRSSRNLKRQMQYFEKLGIEVKDITTGLVDFPSLMNGRIVFLCWRMDEASITHWHELETGFAGRQPIKD